VQGVARSNQEGCPYCNGKKILAGFNDLASKRPDLARDAVGWDPTTVAFSSRKKLRWRCEMDHEWIASVAMRSINGTGCPSCSPKGFDPNKDGWLYFLRHELRGMLQIGISNVPEQRLAVHTAERWELIEVPRGPMPGDITRQWEQDILRALRRRGVKLGPNDYGHFSGFTEAWKEHEFPAESLKELMDLVYYDDESSRKAENLT
jgi:hypothetical protein